MKKVKLGIVGLGQRGKDLLEETILLMDDVEVVALCDEYEDRAKAEADAVKDKKGYMPFYTTNYKELIKREDVEAVIVSTAWEAHTDVAVEALYAGKYVGVEVGGAYAIEDCWQLVRAHEATGSKLMLLENCCYTRRELMCLNMAKKGVFGDIVHCDGGYHHDIRYEVAFGEQNRHYRLRNYLNRNCDNYPTHELGPIAKILNINNGNRMVSLVSIASRSAGLNEYVKYKKGADRSMANTHFAQGDFITTMIKCAGGETITLTLNTTMPRIYSRGIVVNGTNGYFEEASDTVYLDFSQDMEGDIDWGKFDWENAYHNADKYAEQYEHPLWKKFAQGEIKGGHGGGDWIVLRAFFESVMANADPPIDVYDAAAWMSISTLTEDSIAMGGMPVAIPDFTRGKWIKGRTLNQVEDYRLDEIPNI